MRAYAAAHPELPATPLHELPALAAALGLGALQAKDESARFGQQAFKALGAGYAVAALVREGRIAAGGVIVCASEGNHGRAVAQAARLHGLRARVYVGVQVAAARAAAIEAEGAEVVRVSGTYDDAVRTAAADAARHGWQLVSDTSAVGEAEIPRRIMLGYARLMDECARTWGDALPDLVIVPGGVGGLAAAVASWCARVAATSTRLLCVEPLSAACLLASAAAREPVLVPGPHETMMGGLRCGEVSPAAWPAVREGYDAYLAIDDAYVREAMRLLARPSPGAAGLAAGPCGAAGIAALLALRDEPALQPLRNALAIGPATRALVIITEGVTEPALYEAVLAGED